MLEVEDDLRGRAKHLIIKKGEDTELPVLCLVCLVMGQVSLGFVFGENC